MTVSPPAMAQPSATSRRKVRWPAAGAGTTCARESSRWLFAAGRHVGGDVRDFLVRELQGLLVFELSADDAMERRRQGLRILVLEIRRIVALTASSVEPGLTRGDVRLCGPRPQRYQGERGERGRG